MKVGFENLIRNGHAEYGDNANFDDFVYEPTGGVVGGAGCFSKSGQHIVYSTDYIAVNPHDSYELSLFWKTGISGTKIYGGIAMYDVNRNHIDNGAYRIAGYDTTLYEDYIENATIVRVVPAPALWSVNSYIQFNVQDYGQDQPNRHISKITAIDTSNPSYWELTLASGVSQSFSAGIAVGNSESYYPNQYCLGFGVAPGTEWTKAYAEISGINRWDEKPSNSGSKFRRGTRFIRLVFLTNWLIHTTDTTYIDGVVLKRKR